jgi:hypothetical protein
MYFGLQEIIDKKVLKDFFKNKNYLLLPFEEF